MTDFQLYLELGIDHITDLQAYDHMLFVISLCVLFQIKQWKNVLILVTAFTIGHSITLALSVLDIVRINTDLIETLIPITILITSLYNLFKINISKENKRLYFHYSMALIFGLIHGMGFANYLKSLLGGMGNITLPLFSFNLGIELGQIGIVIIYFIVYFTLSRIPKFKHKHWVIGISLIIAAISTWMIFKP